MAASGHRAVRYPQPTCDKCGRFIPFKYGANDFEWWSGGECAAGKGCRKTDAKECEAYKK